jgi:hypothetical protein
MKVVVYILLALLVYGIYRSIADLSKPTFSKVLLPRGLDRLLQSLPEPEFEEKSVLLGRLQDFDEAIRTMAQDGYELVSGDGLYLTFRRYSR